MDNILAILARSLGRILGKITCGLDCDASEFGVTEYIILFLVFIASFFIGLKLIKLLKLRGNKR